MFKKAGCAFLLLKICEECYISFEQL